MEEAKVLYTFDFLGLKLKLTDQCLHSIIVQWAIMAFLIIVAIILTRNLKSKPDKKQTVVEMLVTWIRDLVDKNMGKEYRKFVPLIGTIGAYMLLLNMIKIRQTNLLNKASNFKLKYYFGISYYKLYCSKWICY